MAFCTPIGNVYIVHNSNNEKKIVRKCAPAEHLNERKSFRAEREKQAGLIIILWGSPVLHPVGTRQVAPHFSNNICQH